MITALNISKLPLALITSCSIPELLSITGQATGFPFFTLPCACILIDFLLEEIVGIARLHVVSLAAVGALSSDGICGLAFAHPRVANANDTASGLPAVEALDLRPIA